MAEQIHGWHAVAAVLASAPQRVHGVWLQAGREDERAHAVVAAAQDAGVAVHRVDRRELDQRAQATHQGVIAEVTPRPPADLAALLDNLDARSEPPLLLIADQVQDPRNLGALLRSAAAAGVAAVIVPADRSAALTPAARKTAAGAAELVMLVRVPNLARAMDRLRERGVWIHGLAGDGNGVLYDADLTGPLALALGAEATGLRRLTREHCDAVWHLPMAAGVESLNVSAAGAVALFEAVRQRARVAKRSPIA